MPASNSAAMRGGSPPALRARASIWAPQSSAWRSTPRAPALAPARTTSVAEARSRWRRRSSATACWIGFPRRKSASPPPSPDAPPPAELLPEKEPPSQ